MGSWSLICKVGSCSALPKRYRMPSCRRPLSANQAPAIVRAIALRLTQRSVIAATGVPTSRRGVLGPRLLSEGNFLYSPWSSPRLIEVLTDGPRLGLYAQVLKPAFRKRLLALMGGKVRL